MPGSCTSEAGTVPTRWPRGSRPPGSRRCRIMPGSTRRRARATRTASCATKCGSCARRLHSGWASTRATCASSSTTTSRAASRATIRRPAAPAATDSPPSASVYFSYGDVAKLEHFLDEKEDPNERAVAQAQLERMTRYAYSNDCRRRELLAYFGESWTATDCGACDNCLEPRPAVDVTTDAHKLLSCIERIRRANGHGVGIAHVVDVLLGVDNDKIWRWNHERLSTFGIGRDRPRNGWRDLADELVRLGLIAVDAARFNTVALTASGRTVLAERRAVTVRERPQPVRAAASGPRRRRRDPTTPSSSARSASCARPSPTSATSRPTSSSATRSCGPWRVSARARRRNCLGSAGSGKGNSRTSARVSSPRSPALLEVPPG